jgi:hypothetical protein
MVENTLHFSFGARLLDPTTRLLTLWRIPVVAAAIAGLAVALLKIPVWQPLVIAIKMLGDVSVPLLLFSLGVRMTDVNFSEWKVAGERLAAPAGRHGHRLRRDSCSGCTGAMQPCCWCSAPCRRPCSTSCLPNATSRSRSVSLPLC